MSLQNATPEVLAFDRYFARPRCPRCGDTQLAPERSELVGTGAIHHSLMDHTLIHHSWACDSCGQEFRTEVEFGRDAA